MAGGISSGNLFAGGGYSLRGTEHFPDPFADMASLAMPDNPRDVLRWCEFLMSKVGILREAYRRVLAYFLTDIEIIGDGVERQTKRKYIDYLEDTFDWRNVLSSRLESFLTYGNDFSYLRSPLKRYIACPRCGFEVPLSLAAEKPVFEYRFANYEFHARCPHCAVGAGSKGPWVRRDRRGRESKDIRVIEVTPHNMEIEFDLASGESAYIWKIDEEYRQRIRRGEQHTIERVDWEIVEAVQNDQHLKFNRDTLYHMKEPTLAGIRNQGWGISRLLALFGQAWYVQTLHRFNEAIALDYIVPLRIISPEPSGGPTGSDAFLGDLRDFAATVEAELTKRKTDPNSWTVMPYPIRYQIAGGEANQLAPRDLIEQGYDMLLSAAGIPANLYKLDLTMTGTPPMLRLFGAFWSPLVHAANSYLRFLVKRIGEMLDWEPVSARLVPPRLADDIETQTNLLQLALQRQVSMTSALKPMGKDFEEEQRQIFDEEKFVAEEQEKIQQQMAAAQAAGQLGDPQAQGGGGAPAPGGAAGGGGMAGAPTANQPVTLEQLQGKATEIAQQLLQMPEGRRRSELDSLAQASPGLQAMVKSELERTRRQQDTAAGAQAREQQKSGSAPTLLLPSVLASKRAAAEDRPRIRILGPDGRPVSALGPALLQPTPIPAYRSA